MIYNNCIVGSKLCLQAGALRENIIDMLDNEINMLASATMIIASKIMIGVAEARSLIGVAVQEIISTSYFNLDFSFISRYSSNVASEL